MADRVDTTVDAVEAPGGDAMADGTRGEPERDELAGGDNAVLARGEGGDPPIDRGLDDFRTYHVHFSSRGRHPPEHAGLRRACGARIATIRARLRYAAVASMLRRT